MNPHRPIDSIAKSIANVRDNHKHTKASLFELKLLINAINNNKLSHTSDYHLIARKNNAHSIFINKCDDRDWVNSRKIHCLVLNKPVKEYRCKEAKTFAKHVECKTCDHANKSRGRTRQKLMAS